MTSGRGARGAQAAEGLGPAFWATFLWAEVTCPQRPVRGTHEGTPRVQGVLKSPRSHTQNRLSFLGCRCPALLAEAVGDLGLSRQDALGPRRPPCPPGGMGARCRQRVLSGPDAATCGKFLLWRLARGTSSLKIHLPRGLSVSPCPVNAGRADAAAAGASCPVCSLGPSQVPRPGSRGAACRLAPCTVTLARLPVLQAAKPLAAQCMSPGTVPPRPAPGRPGCTQPPRPPPRRPCGRRGAEPGSSSRGPGKGRRL